MSRRRRVATCWRPATGPWRGTSTTSGTWSCASAGRWHARGRSTASPGSPSATLPTSGSWTSTGSGGTRSAAPESTRRTGRPTRRRSRTSSCPASSEGSGARAPHHTLRARAPPARGRLQIRSRAPLPPQLKIPEHVRASVREGLSPALLRGLHVPEGPRCSCAKWRRSGAPPRSQWRAPEREAKWSLVLSSRASRLTQGSQSASNSPLSL
mmetsp:Transcript_43274/g.116340  ORF Transcript_43274/g.116340 Transcript_43274/m.116340 type:complete len:211 (-) Transcript_43274:115-747(-)